MPFLALPDVRLHYVSTGPVETADGDRPPFLLVHGLAANLAFWYARIAPALARRHRVVMFDLRGHGRSSMPKAGYAGEQTAGDLRALLDHLQIEKAHVVGHSFGGNIALSFACHWPDRVASLTMADVRVRTVQPRLDLKTWAAWPQLRGLLAQVGIEVDEDAEEVAFDLFDRIARVRLEQPSSGEQLPILAMSPFAGNGGETAARRWIELIETTSARDEMIHGAGITLSDIECVRAPALLIYGETSQALPTAHALQRILPDVRLELVPAAGHFFPAKRPDRLIEPLLALVDHVEAAQGAMRASDGKTGLTAGRAALVGAC